MTHSGNPFGQVLVALVTPMTADGEVDWPAVEKHIDDVITAGADGIVVTGTTGETSTMTDPEKLKLVEVGLYDPSAGVGKVDGWNVVVAGAAKLVGKKVSVTVGRVPPFP